MALDADDGLVLGEVLFFFGVKRESKSEEKRVVIDEVGGPRSERALRPSKQFFPPWSFVAFFCDDGACSPRLNSLSLCAIRWLTPLRHR